MKVISAEFVKSVADIRQIPTEGLPEVAFAGRSNVGKSSLINALLNRKKLVQVSSTPGKTRLINFFKINQKFYFVDLPGYGYARVSRLMQQGWQKLIESYLLNSRFLKGVVVLIDIRHPITEADLQLIEWLAGHEIETVIVGTKADKLSGNKLQTQIASNNKILQKIGVDPLLPFSAITGRGKQELWQAITRLISE